MTVVGCAAAWGRGEDAASSCYLVEGRDTAIVLDIGQGSFAALAARRAPETLAAVFVSHAHPDHCIDLIPLRHYLRYEAEAPPGSLALHAPAGLPQRFDALVGESGFLRDLRFSALAGEDVPIASLEIRTAAVTHVEESFAFRVSSRDGGAGLVYSGDCGDPGDLVALLRPGDTLLAEASFGAGPVPPGVAHLDASGAAWAAREGRAARLVLTHLQPTAGPDAALAVARAAWDGETLLARPGLMLDL